MFGALEIVNNNQVLIKTIVRGLYTYSRVSNGAMCLHLDDPLNKLDTAHFDWIRR